MISTAITELLTKKSEIEKKLGYGEYLENEELKKKIQEKWMTYQPKKTVGKFIAIDGGEWVKEIRSKTVYVADAEVVKSEDNNITVLEGKAVADVISSKEGKEFDKEIISLLMQLLELKFAYKYGHITDYILLDGSLTKKIGDHKFKIKETALDNITIDDNVYAFEMAKGDERLLYRYLTAENHVIITKLIEKYGDKLIFVSKDNRSRELLRENISDMALLDMLTKGTGYTRPLKKMIDKSNLFSVLAVKQIGNKPFFSSYVRLSDDGKILKIEMFNDCVEKIVDLLSSISVEGYPYPLLQAHIDVKINKHDREMIKQIFNIKNRSTEWWPNQLF